LPQVRLTTGNFLDRLLDPAVNLGTSTPKADPAGDYTWAMFHHADAIRPGSYEILQQKAQQLGGGATSNAPIDRTDRAVAALGSGGIDVVMGFCPSAQLRFAKRPDLKVGAVPPEIAAGPQYGLAVLKESDPRAPDFALFMLSREGQQIFARHGFAPLGLPA